MGRPTVSGPTSPLRVQNVAPIQEGELQDSPQDPYSASVYSQDEGVSRQPSQSSFAKRYDQIASQIEQSLQTVPQTSAPAGNQLHVAEQAGFDHRLSSETFREAAIAFKDFDGVHFSPDTEEHVGLDNPHDEMRRVSERTSSASLLDHASLLRMPHFRPTSYGVPPPSDGMVYYPAPIPRMLNMPKRLSQMPSAAEQARRRSQLLSELPPEARRSAPWLSHPDFGDSPSNRRPQSALATHPEEAFAVLDGQTIPPNAASVPSQLRASVYFQHPSVARDVEVKSESAVATLDSILAASATAPVSVFTDHPFAGNVRNSVFAPEKAAARSSTSLGTVKEAEALKKRRSSSFGHLLRRSTNMDDELKKKESRSSLGNGLNEYVQKLPRPQSQLSLGDEMRSVLDPSREARQSRVPSGSRSLAAGESSEEEEETDDVLGVDSRPHTAMSGKLTPGADDHSEQDGNEGEEDEEDLHDREPVFAQPTTLLAELQVRKAQQKSRNRTAATAFPNGMHSTLLELDAVEEVSRRRRKNHRTALAWEDPNMRLQDAERDGDDEEVPLGMLFPSKDGLMTRKTGDARDWNRPIGLMEKRQLEDNEPLSSRRNRLRGISPTKARAFARPSIDPASQADATNGDNAGDEEGETLAQRLRRLKTKDALDTAISDVAPKNGEPPKSTFTDDVLSQFGGMDPKENPAKGKVTNKGKPTTPGPEEETLGQRRARLQRERQTSGEQPNTGGQPSMRPALRSTQSMANLISTNPNEVRNFSGEQRPGPSTSTLLQAGSEAQSKHKQDLVNANMRTSSMMMLNHNNNKPLVDPHPPSSGPRMSGMTSPHGLLGKQSGMPVAGGFAKGLYNNGNGGVVPSPSPNLPTTPVFAMPTTFPPGGYFHNAGSMMAQSSNPLLQYQYQQQQQSMFNPSTYAALNGGRPSMMMPMMPMMPSPSPQPQQNSFPMFSGWNIGALPQQQPNQLHYSVMPQMHASAAPPQMSYGAPHAGLGVNMNFKPNTNMNMNMGPVTDPSMDPQQRAVIDRWRMGVAQ